MEEPTQLEITLTRVRGKECETLTIPECVTDVGYCVCVGLKAKTVALPTTLRRISVRAFDSCPNLESVVIPDRVIDIGDCAFENCSKLKLVTIKNARTHLHYETFGGCPKLTICAPNGSNAEVYAKEHGIKFRALKKK